MLKKTYHGMAMFLCVAVGDMQDKQPTVFTPTSIVTIIRGTLFRNYREDIEPQGITNYELLSTALVV